MAYRQIPRFLDASRRGDDAASLRELNNCLRELYTLPGRSVQAGKVLANGGQTLQVQFRQPFAAPPALTLTRQHSLATASAPAPVLLSVTAAGFALHLPGSEQNVACHYIAAATE